jgi:hypothetical protein
MNENVVKDDLQRGSAVEGVLREIRTLRQHDQGAQRQSVYRG